jgi:hypothetical protein
MNSLVFQQLIRLSIPFHLKLLMLKLGSRFLIKSAHQIQLCHILALDLCCSISLSIHHVHSTVLFTTLAIIPVMTSSHYYDSVIELPRTIGAVHGFAIMMQIDGFNSCSRFDRFLSQITLMFVSVVDPSSSRHK